MSAQEFANLAKFPIQVVFGDNIPTQPVRDLGGLLQRAGFTLPVTDVETVTVRYGDPFGLMRDLRAMGLTNALRERRGRLRRETLMRAASLYAERFADPDGRLRATFELIWLSGWVPHESQQKPLRPGSAQARLACSKASAARGDRPFCQQLASRLCATRACR